MTADPDPPPSAANEAAPEAALEAALARIAFDRNGLAPAIAQQHDTGKC